MDFRVHAPGQQFSEQPAVFADMRARLEAQIATRGMVQGQADYRRILQRAQIVLSTALHEFLGLAVQEAVASGCVPLVPDRLAYTDCFSVPDRYPPHVDEPGREAAAIAGRIQQWVESGPGLPPVPGLSGLSWAQQKSAYAAERGTLGLPRQ